MQLLGDEQIYRWEKIRIVGPDGGVTETYIKDIEFINRSRDRGGVAFLLPKHIKASEIVDGSELWLVRDRDAPELHP